MEEKYDFLKRFREIHRPERWNDHQPPHPGEIAITGEWTIAIPANASKMLRRATLDFQHYLFTSMDLSLPIEYTDKPANHRILLLNSGDDKKRGAFTLTVGPGVTVSGDDDRGVLYGAIHLEDLMNLREAPYLQCGRKRREPLLRMRLVHSGSGVDDFPDWQLNAIVHAGFNAIDVFVRDIDTVADGSYRNIAELIDRAAEYGLDTVLYNYMKCFKHPDDDDAEEAFDQVYGRLLRAYPQAKAISLVGESLEFPSRDPHTTGKPFRDSVVDGIPEVRPSPGWYPCSDYPALLRRIENAVHKVSPDTEIIFSTYNWSYESEKNRRQFLQQIPKDITVNIAYVMLHDDNSHGLRRPVMDYTVKFADPGHYFESESRIAHDCGLRIRSTTNTAGLTWDVGCVPYIPVPQLWLERMRKLLPYVKNRGVDSFYECHHYGWFPNVAQDLAKQLFYSPENDCGENFLRCLARRDYGTEQVVEVWDKWSRALTKMVTSNEDQYGPLRVGPAYPFIFHCNITRTMLPKEIPFPCSPHAFMGNGIIKTFYQPYENINQSPGIDRYPQDIADLTETTALWTDGLDQLTALLPTMPEPYKKDAGERLCALGKFIVNTIKTTINIKCWYLLNLQLKSSQNCLGEMLELLNQEEANVRDTLPAVQTDSRLGWEPSMGYVCDQWHLEWKLRQLDAARREIKQFQTIQSVR